MKLAFIRRQFSATGGAELYLQRLLHALIGQGHSPHLFCERWAEPMPGLTLHTVAARGGRGRRPVYFAEDVQRLLDRDSFDCVFSMERTCRQDIYRAGDGLHRVWLERRREFAPWWKRAVMNWSRFHRALLKLEARTFDPQNTRQIIANSAMVKSEIVQHFHFPEDRIQIVRNGVDLERFRHGQRERAREKFGVGPEERLFLFVGSGWERKGLRFVVEALRRLESRPSGSVAARAPGLKLLVAGKGRKPRRLPPGVILAGPVEEVEDVYAAADLLLMLPLYEPAANVVFEALASGLPVITTAFNGASEVIENGRNGSVVARPDALDQVEEAVRFWLGKLPVRVQTDETLLSLDRNVRETLALIHDITRTGR